MKRHQLLIFGGFVVFFFLLVVFLFYQQQRQLSQPIPNVPATITPLQTHSSRNRLYGTPILHIQPKKLNPLGNTLTRNTIVNALSANGFVFLKDTSIAASDPYYGGQEAYSLQQVNTGTIVTIIGDADNVVKIVMTVPLSSITNYDVPFNNISALENAIDPEMIHWLYITYQDMVQKLQANQITMPLKNSISVNSIFYTLSLANQPTAILTLSLQSAQ